MPGPLDTSQAQALKDQGLISEDQYASFVPQSDPALPTPGPTVDSATTLPESAPDPEPSPQPKSVGYWSGALDFAKPEPESTPEEEARIVEAQRKDLEKRIEVKKANAKRYGVNPEDFVKDEMDQLAALPEVQLASHQTEPEGQVQLASDGETINLGPQNMPGADTSAFDMMTAAEATRAQIGQERAAEEGAYIAEAIKQQEQLQAEQADSQARQQQYVSENMEKLQAQVNEVANLEVDPDRYYKNMGTSNKIAAVIGAIMAGYATKGKSNQVLNMLENSAAQDIKAQQADMANKRAGVANKQGLYDRMMRQFNDEQLAYDASMSATLNRAKTQLEATASKFRGKEAQANAMAAIGEIELKRQAYEAKVAERSQMIAFDRYAGVPKEVRERMVPGYGVALTKEGASKVNEKAATVNTAKDGINDLLEMTKMTGKSLNPAQRARAESTAQMLIGNLRTEVVGPGAMNEREVELMNDIIADPTRILSLDAVSRASLETILRRLDSSMDQTAKAYGLTPERDRLGVTDR